MPVATSGPDGSVSIHYETHGFDDDPPLLLIAGLGNQLIFWEDEFVQGLLDRAFRVITFDNRDVGLSTGFEGEADLFAVLAGDQEPPYSIGDMTADAVAVLDAAGVEQAHVLGVSLGGLVAQGLALDHAERVTSLTLLSSTTGAPDVGQATSECLDALLEPPPPDRQGVIDYSVRVRELWSTPEHYDPDWTRAYFERAAERGEIDGGSTRQMAAVLSAPHREADLAELDVPTLVLHGTADPLIAPSGSERLAELIPGAELVLLEGMAHDLPPHYWAPVIESVTQLAIRSL